MSNKKKKTGGERKPNWKEYMATVEDIQNFLMDRIVLRHNVITKRVEYRAPLSSSVANEGFAPLCGAAATPVAALKSSVANEGFAPLCGAAATSGAALKTPVASEGG